MADSRSTPTGYDMSRHWRLVSIDGGLVTGVFWVAAPSGRDQSQTVSTVDVIVWSDLGHSRGRVFGSKDATVWIEDGQPSFNPNAVPDAIRADAIERQEEIKAAALAAATAVTFEGGGDDA